MGDVDDVGGIFCEQRKYVTGRNEGTGGKNTKYTIESITMKPIQKSKVKTCKERNIVKPAHINHLPPNSEMTTRTSLARQNSAGSLLDGCWKSQLRQRYREVARPEGEYLNQSTQRNHIDFHRPSRPEPSLRLPLRPAPQPFSRKSDVAIRRGWVRLELPTGHGFCDPNARNSGASIISLPSPDSASKGASIHTDKPMLTCVVELLRRGRGNFASSSLFATVTSRFPKSSTRTPTRHPPAPQRRTSSKCVTFYSMFGLLVAIYFGSFQSLLRCVQGQLSNTRSIEIDFSTNPTSPRVANSDLTPRSSVLCPSKENPM